MRIKIYLIGLVVFLVCVAGYIIHDRLKPQKIRVKNVPLYCVMITGYHKEREPFARVSVLNFFQQTYANKHLIILNQSEKALIDTEHDNVLELFVDTMVLGKLRNIALEFIPPNAIWTTWDDDDYRHPTYLQTFANHFLIHDKVDFLMFQNRLEYNLKTKFSFKMTLKSGFMTFFSKRINNLKYDEISSMEDVVVKKTALKKYNCVVINNDPTLYLRFTHNSNTSKYVNQNKTSVTDTRNNRDYFETELNSKERKYITKILSNYY